jgi:hypothetical protein
VAPFLHQAAMMPGAARRNNKNDDGKDSDD